MNIFISVMYILIMSEQYILHLPVKKETYDLYMSRYADAKKDNRNLTHDTLMKKLLGMS